MEFCVKQEKFESDFESGSAHSTPWEVYGSWIDTTESISKDHLSKSAELVIPLRKGSHLLSEEDMFRYEESINRAKREFVPEEKKDTSYWDKRLKNNASARRSRLKKKVMEKRMETKLQELQRENIELKYELAALKRHFANQLDTKREDTSPDSRSDLSMRTGSASDTSDSSSVTSEGDTYHGSYDAENVVATPVSALTSSTTNAIYASTSAFPYQNGWHIPFNYSFMPYSTCDKERKDNNLAESEGESRNKIPHKFRHKKDFHSAFYAHPYSDNKA